MSLSAVSPPGVVYRTISGPGPVWPSVHKDNNIRVFIRIVFLYIYTFLFDCMCEIIVQLLLFFYCNLVDSGTRPGQGAEPISINRNTENIELVWIAQETHHSFSSII